LIIPKAPFKAACESASRAVTLSAAVLILCACSTLTPPVTRVNGNAAEEVAPISGRLGVQVAQDAERSFSANFELQGNAKTGRLTLTTPIGIRIAQAHWEPGEARLESGSDTRYFADLDTLADEVFQQRIPLAALIDWLAGRPWPDAPNTPLAAPAVGFSQLQWLVQLDRWPEGFITATSRSTPVVTVRARLDRP